LKTIDKIVFLATQPLVFAVRKRTGTYAVLLHGPIIQTGQNFPVTISGLWCQSLAANFSRDKSCNISSRNLLKEIHFDRGHIFFVGPLDTFLADLGILQFQFWANWAKGASQVMDVTLNVAGSFDG
jgi:hypothetical protein